MSRFIHPIQAQYKSPSGYEAEYRSYLQQQEYVRDISSAIASAGNQYSQTIQAVGRNISGEIRTMSKMQCEAIQKSTTQIVGALDKGFNQLGNIMQNGFNEVNKNLVDIKFQLQNVENAIDRLGGLIDRKLNAVLEQQHITNLGIQQLITIAKIPEFQKERIYYFEEGLKFLNNALIDPRRYSDALENFLEAEKRKKTDYLVLYNIGLIHLYSSENLNLELAEEYFLKAGDYADDEISPDAIRSNKAGFSSEKMDENFVIRLAVESYQHAANSQLVQNKFEDALKSANEAIKISNKALEAKYIAAQAHLALGNIQESFELIKELSIDNNYLIDASFNPNLAEIDGLQELIEDTRKVKRSNTENKLNMMLSIMDKNSAIGQKSVSLLDSLTSDDTLLNIIKIEQMTK